MVSIKCEACGSVMQQQKEWIYRCPQCGFLISTLKPAEGTGIPGLESLRRYNFEIILDQLEKMRPLTGAHILEVGSAWGWFLEAAHRRGAQVRGIEPEAANAELSRKRGLDVEVGFFPDDLRQRAPYDIIIFNDVFEHLPRPSNVVRCVEQLLVVNGMLVLNLPSSGGILFKLATTLDVFGSSSWLDRLWQKGFPSPHVSYFNPNNLKMLVENHSGLRLRRKFPLKSVAHEGLSERIDSSHKAVLGLVALLGVWSLSFVLPILPPDITVLVFTKSPPLKGWSPVTASTAGAARLVL